MLAFLGSKHKVASMYSGSQLQDRLTRRPAGEALLYVEAWQSARLHRSYDPANPKACRRPGFREFESHSLRILTSGTVSVAAATVPRLSPWDWAPRRSTGSNIRLSRRFCQRGRQSLKCRIGPVMNLLSRDKQIEIIAALTGGVGIRATARLVGVNRETVGKLALQVGKGCAELHDRRVLGVRVARIELDEV